MKVLEALDYDRWKSLLGIQAEVNTTGLYKNSATFEDLIPFIYQKNFKVYEITNNIHFPLVKSYGHRLDSTDLLDGRLGKATWHNLCCVI
jgi:hypothetical protein